MLHTVILRKSFLLVCVVAVAVFFGLSSVVLWTLWTTIWDMVYIWEQIICVDTVKMGNALKFPWLEIKANENRTCFFIFAIVNHTKARFTLCSMLGSIDLFILRVCEFNENKHTHEAKEWVKGRWNCLWCVCFVFRFWAENSANWKSMWSLCCVRCVFVCVWYVRCAVCVVYNNGINGWKSFAHVFSPFYSTTD